MNACNKPYHKAVMTVDPVCLLYSATISPAPVVFVPGLALDIFRIKSLGLNVLKRAYNV